MIIDDQHEKNVEIARMDFERSRQEVADRLRFQVEFAQAVLKNLTLVNGAAIVSLFTFIGHDGDRFDFKYIWWSFASFSLGLSLVLLAFLGGFFFQLFFMNASGCEMWNAQSAIVGEEGRNDVNAELKKGNRALFAGIGLALLSLVAFIVGSACALLGVR